MKCPNCGLTNPPEAQLCDCGYDFEKNLLRRRTLIDQAADSLKHRPPNFDAETIRDIERIENIIRTSPEYGQLPPNIVLEKLVRGGEDLGLAALALDSVLSARRTAALRGDFGYGEWVKCVAARPLTWKNGPSVLLLIGGAIIATVWGAVASSALAPSGRYYPWLVFVVPGIAAGVGFFLLGGFLIYAFGKARQRTHRKQSPLARAILRLPQRPRTLLEQIEIVQRTRSAIGYLGTECGVLLKALGKDVEESSLSRFAEGWRNLAERLKAEITEFAFVKNLGASSTVMKRLRSAQETAVLVQKTLASGQADQILIERVAALDRQSKELLVILAEFLSRVQRDLPEDSVQAK